jgi:hypothetical protein
MTKSIEELITESVVTALQGITVAAGYDADVSVQRMRVAGNDIASNVITLVDGDLAYHDQQSLGRDRWIKNYSVICPIKSPEDDTHGAKSASHRANVYKAMMVDVHRNGYAVDTRVLSMRSDTSAETPHETIEFEVHFFTNKDDPFSNEDIT